MAHWSPPASTRVENVGEVAMKSELFLAAALLPRPGERGRRGKEGGGREAAGRGADFVFGVLPGSISGESFKCVQLSLHRT